MSHRHNLHPPRTVDDLCHDMRFLLEQLSMMEVDQDRTGIRTIARRNGIVFPYASFGYTLAMHDSTRQRKPARE